MVVGDGFCLDFFCTCAMRYHMLASGKLFLCRCLGAILCIRNFDGAGEGFVFQYASGRDNDRDRGIMRVHNLDRDLSEPRFEDC